VTARREVDELHGRTVGRGGTRDALGDRRAGSVSYRIETESPWVVADHRDAAAVVRAADDGVLDVRADVVGERGVEVS
jgi:hypothetical protein